MNISIKAISFLHLIIFITCRFSFSLSKLDWKVKIQNISQQFNAKIPSTLSDVLVENRLINGQPYFRDNFLQFYNFQTRKVTYRTNFSLPLQQIKKAYQYLIFQGLDTHADVYLNGKIILSSHNMFRSYEVRVVFQIENQLIVYFNSSALYDLQRQKQFKQKYGFKLPANYSFTRKAAYQYGWDWGPRILTVGIWKDINILTYDEIRVQNLRFTHSVIRKQNDNITCFVDFDVKNLKKQNKYKLFLNVDHFFPISQQIYQDSFQVNNIESNHYQLNFTIEKNIQKYIWWTWDLGQQNLIGVTVELINIDNNQYDYKSINTGIRTINVIQSSNKYNGTSFTFNINGYDVYMRGGNYIPPQMSMTKVYPQKYQNIAKDALFAHFNMIRVWGGGQFQNEQFYRVMDKSGILLWHDLMFACALYPSSDEINDNVRQQMIDNVKRIRHHPSIGLWNGNNQVWIGWQEWGWQSGLNELQKSQVQNMYGDIFKKVLPQVLKQYHPQIYYYQTSPSVSSNSVKTINSGDIHFWRVWGAGTPIQQYEQYVGRFNSQYGMQSTPDMASIMKFTDARDWSIDSMVMKLHQRHPLGTKLLPEYTYNYTSFTDNFTRYTYFTQIMQSYALEKAVSTLRLRKPYNMGSLYWQLNDVWPVSSWATVDYYGTYKAAHYKLRDLYQPIFGHTYHNTADDSYIISIVNDYNRQINCSVEIFWKRNDNFILDFQIFNVSLGPLSIKELKIYNKSKIINNIDSSFIKTIVKKDGKIINSNIFNFVTLKNKINIVPILKYEIKNQILTISSNKLASYVWIYRKQGSNFISLKLNENYFHLDAGQTKEIQIGNIPSSQISVTCFQIQKQNNNIQKITILTQ